MIDLKIGTRVYLKYATTDDKSGTVVAVNPDDSFSVRYDSARDDRNRKIRGGLFHYHSYQREGFVRGNA